MRLRRLALPLLAVVGLAACGDDAGGAGSGGGATTGAGGASTGAGPSSSASAGGGPASSSGSGGGPGAGGASSSSGTGGGATGTGGGGAGSGGAGSGGAGSGGAGSGGGEGAGGPADGYGEIAGACGTIDARDVLDPEPSVVANELDLSGEPPITEDDPSALTQGGQEILADGNLGGSSVWSEVFAFEVLARCEGAQLVKTEGEIDYTVEGKKTDILVSIDGARVGVSVVRAVGFPPEDPYLVEDALPVLEGKLDDILESSANVAPEDAWEKQILSVIAYSEGHAQAMLDAYELLDDATRADTILVVTATHGDDDFIYFGE